MDITKKVPLFVIFIVIIFILVIIILLSSLGSSEKSVEKSIPKIKTKKDKKITFSNVNITTVHAKKELDSLCFEFQDLTHDITYIFGSEFDNSTISIYKKEILDEENLSQESLFFTNVYSGNHGFVLSSNPLNVNASYFQLGTKLKLENIKYNCIYLEPNVKYKVVVNNVINSLYKIYRFTINYDIRKKSVNPSIIKNLKLGLSEYDLEHKIKKDLELKGLKIKERMMFTRLGFKEWEFSKNGNYVLVFLKNKYNFVIKDRNSESEWKSNITKDGLYELEYQILENPNLLIKNLDENLKPSSFNSDFVEFINTPFTLYNHFLHGPKSKKVDIINKISNKILIYSL
jgi:hypothetical protein